MTRSGTRRPVVAVLFATFAICAQASYAQSGVAESQQYLRDANEAYAAADFPGMIRSLEKARELNPESLSTRYSAPDDIEQYGIDGLYLYQGDLVAVQHGIKPWRLMRFKLNEDLTAITAAKILEFGNPLIVATTGAIVGNNIHLIGRRAPVGKIPAHIPDAMREFVGRSLIMTTPLD